MNKKFEVEIEGNKELSKARITDENGIVYEEVDYNTYLNSTNKLRIIKHLNAQYFVEIKNGMVRQKDTNEEKIIKEFLERKKKMERFIREELNNIKSPIRERLK